MNTLPPDFYFKTSPMDHQRKTLERSWMDNAHAAFWTMGTGKTKFFIDNIALLFHTKKIVAAVVASDKGNYRNWISEFQIHFPEYLKYRMLVWDASFSKRKADELGQMVAYPLPNCLDVLLLNTETFSRPRCPGLRTLELFMAKRRSGDHIIVLDESSSIKGHDSVRTRTACNYALGFAYRRIGTGTPNPQSPLDFWGQMNFLKPNFLGKSYWAFRARYAITEKVYLPGRPPFEQVVGYQNLEELMTRIHPYSSRFTKEECFDLPEKIYQIYTLEMTAEQSKAYVDLIEQCVTEFQNNSITAVDALSRINKLRQISSGWVKNDDGEIVHLSKRRLEALRRVLDEIDTKVVIWCAYQEDVRMVKSLLGEEAVTYYGEDDTEERSLALKKFKGDPKVRYFVGTTATGGKGLTLVESSTMIFYSNVYSLEHRLQAEDRIHRWGQKNACTYVDLVCEGTVDEDILKALKDKHELAHAALTFLKQVVERKDT